MSARDVLADIIRDHGSSEWDVQVADAILKDPRIAVVELPSATSSTGDDEFGWYVPLKHGEVWIEYDAKTMRDFPEEADMVIKSGAHPGHGTARDAQALAAALLAAARKAVS